MSTLQGGPGTIVTEGLVLYLDAANHASYTSGSNTWYDLAGSNNGTLTNGPTFSPDNAGSIVFDGVDDKVTLNIPNNTNSASIEVWCKTNTVASSQILFAYDNGTNQRFYLGFRSNDSWDVGIQNLAWTSTDIIPDTEWNHFIVTLDNGTASVYRNGNLVRTRNYTTFALVDSTLNISSNFLNNYWWNGQVSLFKSHNRALTASEVLQNYNALKGRFGL